MLANMLGRHPQVVWAGEIFHAWQEGKISLREKDRIGDPMLILERELESCKSPVFGFESKFKHLNKNGLDLSITRYVEKLKANAFTHFIVLRRENMLRQAISVIRGKAMQQWHFSKDEQPPKDCALTLNPKHLSVGGYRGAIAKCFHDLENDYRQIETVLNGDNVLQLTYEKDIQNDPTVAYKRICEFCKIDCPGIQPDLRQIHSKPVRQLIDNYDEVAKALQETEFEWMLDT